MELRYDAWAPFYVTEVFLTFIPPKLLRPQYGADAIMNLIYIG